MLGTRASPAANCERLRTACEALLGLRDRLLRPEAFAPDPAALAIVTAVVDSRTGPTAAGRALQSISTALAPLEAWLAADGWAYDRPGRRPVPGPTSRSWARSGRGTGERAVRDDYS